MGLSAAIAVSKLILFIH